MIHLFDKTYLTADNRQFICFEKEIVKKGKTKGSYYDTNFKYFPTMEHLLRFLLNRETRRRLASEEITTLMELKEAHADAFSDIQCITGQLSKEGLKISNV